MALRIYDTLVPQGDYPAVKAEDVQMPDGTKLSELEIPEASGGVSSWNDLTDKPFGEVDNREFLFPEQDVEGFAVSMYGMMGVSISPAPFAPVIGETYSILWEDQVYDCEAIDVSAAMPGVVAMGNGAAFDFPDNNEPFIVAVSAVDINFFVVDTSDQREQHHIAIFRGGIAVKTLDAKYLPMEAIDERIDAYISAALEGEF